MIEFSIIIAIITLIVSILQIILFFKIWKMTNDIADIKVNLKTMLYRELPVEKRKKELINICHKVIIDYALLVGGESKLIVEQKVSETIDKYDKSIKEKIEVYDLVDVYNIEELKRDVAERFS